MAKAGLSKLVNVELYCRDSLSLQGLGTRKVKKVQAVSRAEAGTGLQPVPGL